MLCRGCLENSTSIEIMLKKSTKAAYGIIPLQLCTHTANYSVRVQIFLYSCAHIPHTTGPNSCAHILHTTGPNIPLQLCTHTAHYGSKYSFTVVHTYRTLGVQTVVHTYCTLRVQIFLYSCAHIPHTRGTNSCAHIPHTTGPNIPLQLCTHTAHYGSKQLHIPHTTGPNIPLQLCTHTAHYGYKHSSTVVYTTKEDCKTSSKLNFRFSKVTTPSM